MIVAELSPPYRIGLTGIYYDYENIDVCCLINSKSNEKSASWLSFYVLILRFIWLLFIFWIWFLRGLLLLKVTNRWVYLTSFCKF